MANMAKLLNHSTDILQFRIVGFIFFYLKEEYIDKSDVIIYSDKMFNPIIDFICGSYQDSPVMTVIGCLIAVVLCFWLFRAAAKLFMVLVLLAIVGLLAVYFLEGEEAATDVLRQAEDKVLESTQ